MKKNWILLCILWGFSLAAADVIVEDFSSAAPGTKLPPGWKQYGTNSRENFTEVIFLNGKKALRIVDKSAKETGIFRDFPAKPGKFYRGTAHLTLLGNQPPRDTIRMQLRFIPKKGTPTYVWNQLKFHGITELSGIAPANAETIRVYIYTSFNAVMDAALHSFRLEELDAPPLSLYTNNPRKGFVPPILALKDLCSNTPLDKVTIFANSRYAGVAARIADALAQKTGVRPAILPDTAKAAGHKILLGNRDTNQIIEYMYRRYFAYTDIVYPGKGGYELRTVHNPFGNKENYIIVGGSDDAGVAAAADRLIAKAGKTLPPTIDVKLFPALPKDIPSTEYVTRLERNFPGYGWCTLSWLLEMYYRSGDAGYAREFIRLGLNPKPEDVPLLKKVNAESSWDFSRPLATPYHYMGHYITLLWDLVEEQDVFTDAERLAVTRELARQIIHPDINMRYYPDVAQMPPSNMLGDRHAQWSVVMMYVLARYMNRDYPHPVWQNALKCAEYFHDPIFREGTWGIPESTFSWFASSMLNGPSQYLLLSGKGRPHPRGMLMNAVKVYEILWEPGINAPANGTMSVHNHRLLAAITGNPKFYYYAQDLDRPSATMKLGQSYRTAGDQANTLPDITGRWLTAPLPPAGCVQYHLPRPYAGYTLNTGYRDTLDGTGDRVMFDLFNEMGRRPYQLNTLYSLRLNGAEYLSGYENSLQVLKNGIAAPHIPIAARLRKTGIAGNFVYHVSSVPDMAHAEWERTLVLKKRKAALIADRFTSRAPGRLQAVLNWSIPRTSPVFIRDNRISFQKSSCILASQLKWTADGPVTPASNARTARLAKAGDSFRTTLNLTEPFSGDLLIQLVKTSKSVPRIDIALDGVTRLRNVPMFTNGTDIAESVLIRSVDLSPGKHTLTFTVAAPGAPGNLQVWFFALAEKNNFCGIAGAGMTAGRTYHKTSLPPLQQGENHTVFTIFGDNIAAEKTAGHPNAALLYIPEKTLAFSGEFKPFGKGRLVWVDEKETAVMDETYQITVRPTTREAALALKTLQAANTNTVEPPSANLPIQQARHTAKAASAPALAEAITFKGQPALLTAGQGCAQVLSPTGKVLLTLQIPGRIMSMHGTENLLLFGTVEDKVFAFDHQGKKRWTHTALCATPPEKQKHYYWFKGYYPGVYAISSMNGDIYTGGACTVERLSGDGKVIRRYEQFWGPQSQLRPLIRKDGSMRMLSARINAGHSADIYAVNPADNTSRIMFRGTLAGFRDFPAFSAMFRSRMLLQDINGDGRQEIAASSAGMYSWLQIFDDNGKILHQANLGGSIQLTGMAAGKDILAIVDTLQRLIIFDGSLNVKACKDLPEFPRQVELISGEIFVLHPNGVTVYDRSGTALRNIKVPAAWKIVPLQNGTVCILDQTGNISFY